MPAPAMPANANASTAAFDSKAADEYLGARESSFLLQMPHLALPTVAAPQLRL